VHILCLNCIKIHISGIFPETAWRVLNYCQATYNCCVFYRFQRWNRLAARAYPPGDAWLITQFMVFLDEWSDGDEHPPGDTSNMAQFCCFVGSGWILNANKGSLNCALIIGLYNFGNFTVIGVNSMKLI